VGGRLCSALLSILIFFGIAGAQAIWVNFLMLALSGSAGMRAWLLRELVTSPHCGWWRLNGALARTSGQTRDTTLHGVLVKTLLYVFVHVILLSTQHSSASSGPTKMVSISVFHQSDRGLH
jgi:hypothetical protein